VTEVVWNIGAGAPVDPDSRELRFDPYDLKERDMRLRNGCRDALDGLFDEIPPAIADRWATGIEEALDLDIEEPRVAGDQRVLPTSGCLSIGHKTPQTPTANIVMRTKAEHKHDVNIEISRYRYIDISRYPLPHRDLWIVDKNRRIFVMRADSGDTPVADQKKSLRTGRKPAQGDKRKFLATMDPELIRALKFAAIEDETSASEALEAAVQQWLERRKKSRS
jgi:hypothetical protein